MSVVVAPPERTSLEQVSAALIGDEANALAQLGLLIATLLILALLTRRRKNKSSADPWQNTDFEAGEEQTEKVFEKHALLEQVQNRRPVNSPSSVLFALSEVPTISHLLLSPSNLNCQPLQLSPKPVSNRFNKRNFIHQFQKVGCQKVGLKSNGRITGNNTSMPNPLILNPSHGTENQASQVGERFRSCMNRFGPVVFGLIFLMLTCTSYKHGFASLKQP